MNDPANPQSIRCCGSILTTIKPKIANRMSVSVISVMATFLPVGSLIFGIRFLITLLHPLLLPVLNVNSVSFTLMNSHSFHICFHFLVFGAPVSAALRCLCVLFAHCFLFCSLSLVFCIFVSQNKFDLICLET